MYDVCIVNLISSEYATSFVPSKAVQPLSVVLGRLKASPFTRQSRMSQSQADPSSREAVKREE